MSAQQLFSLSFGHETCALGCLHEPRVLPLVLVQESVFTTGIPRIGPRMLLCRHGAIVMGPDRLFSLSLNLLTPLRYCSGLLHNKLNLWLCCVSQSCNVVAFPSFSHNCVMIYGNLGASHPRCVLIYSFHKDRKTFSMFILLLYLISVVCDACVFDKILCFPRVFPCR